MTTRTHCLECGEDLHIEYVGEYGQDMWVDWAGNTGCVDKVNPANGFFPHETPVGVLHYTELAR
jgi:hypothetical protein